MAQDVPGLTLHNMVNEYYTSADLKAMLTTGAFVFNKHTVRYRSQVTNEVTGTGYTSGGITLAGVQVQLNTGNSTVNIVADEANFGVITVNGIANIVIYLNTGNSATDEIVAVHSISPTVDVDNVQFSYYFAGDTTGATLKGIISTYNY